jgi:hypothetical protein
LGTLLIFSSLCAVIVGRLPTGDINTSGLLSGRKGNDDLYFSPERVQLLLFCSAAFEFLTDFLRPPAQFPQVSGTLLALFGSSHLLYLGGKVGAAFFIGRDISN